MCLGHAGSTELTAGHDRAQIKRPSGGGVSGFFSRERFFFGLKKCLARPPKPKPPPRLMKSRSLYGSGRSSWKSKPR